jgi:hypothetical protein
MHVDQSPKKRKEFAQKFPTPKTQTPELEKQKTKNKKHQHQKKKKTIIYRRDQSIT